jgi:hypothetical protein
VDCGSFLGGVILLGSGKSEVPVMRVRIVLRRFIASIVLAVAVIAAGLAVAGAVTAHHSLADNGVVSSRN